VIQLLHDGDLLTDEKEGIFGLLRALFGEARIRGVRGAEARAMEAAKLPWSVAENIGLRLSAEPGLGECLDSLKGL